MKRSRLKSIGKIGKENSKANKIIAKQFMDHEIYYCEVCPVLHELGLLTWQCLQAGSNAHRKSRLEYRGDLSKLSNFKQVVRACIPAHDYIDNVNPGIKETVFMILRGTE